ncbi:MAG: hypothetical protein QNJ98_19890 [Planctomycetota bacterium]|nr:hypothetical protein [Planctomycetota bacterium]
MRTALPLLAAAALVAVLAWLLLGEEPTTEDPGYLEEAGPVEPKTGDGPMAAEDSGLTGTNTGKPKPKRRSHDPMKPYKPRMGVLEVLPLDPDGEPIDADLCTVSLELIRGNEPSGKLGLRDRETMVWRFEKVPIGPIRVVITGDHLVEAREIVRVRERSTTFKKIGVERGALVSYTAALANGEVPEKVRLELINHQGRATSAWWQVREPKLLTSARRAKAITLSAKGVVYGIRPGVYRLKASTLEEPVYTDWQEIVVGAGDTTEVELRLR